jgi:transposase
MRRAASGRCECARENRSGASSFGRLLSQVAFQSAKSRKVAETGREGLAQLAEIVTDESNREALPSAMKQALQAIIDQLAALELQIGTLDRAIHAHHRANDMSCSLETVPGIGVIGATAIASTVTEPSNFKSGRDFAAWIGLVPRQHSTGGKGAARRQRSAELPCGVCAVGAAGYIRPSGLQSAAARKP